MICKKPSPELPPNTVLKGVTRHVGGHIRRRRKTMGLTQQELGRLTGTPAETIGHMEQGMDILTAGQLYSLANALRVNVDCFFQGLDSDEDRVSLEDKARGKEANMTESAQVTELATESATVSARELKCFLEAYDAIADPRVRQTLFDLLLSMAMETPGEKSRLNPHEPGPCSKSGGAFGPDGPGRVPSPRRR